MKLPNAPHGQDFYYAFRSGGVSSGITLNQTRFCILSVTQRRYGGCAALTWLGAVQLAIFPRG